jgi:signal peptidase II
MKKSKKYFLFSGLIVLVLLALDQVTKYLSVICLKDKHPIPIIKDVFELQYLENRSAAFGVDPISILHNIFHFQAFENDPQLFLTVKMIFFVILTIAIVGIFVVLYTKIPSKKKFMFMDIVLILFVAGAIGNFIDRVKNQYVVDFLYFKLINFPIFNVADIYVTVAAFAMVFLVLFYYKDEDFEEIFPPKKKLEELSK